MELTQAIRERRSVRRFTDYQVTDAEINELLEAARQAPSWANTQVWEFVVVRDHSLIEKIAPTFLPPGGNPASKGALAASVLLVACAKTGVSGCYSGKDMTKFREWFMFDMGMAVQNMCLKAHELGLGTVVVGLMDHDACKALIGLPEGYEVVAALPIGKPAVVRGSPGRKEIAAFTHLDSFLKPYIAG
jgi:nitroreductase